MSDIKKIYNSSYHIRFEFAGNGNYMSKDQLTNYQKYIF